MWTKIRKEKEPEKTLAKRGIKKIDTIVTAMVLGGIIASIYGFKKSTPKIQDLTQDSLEKWDQHSLASVIQLLIFGVDKDTKSSTLWQKVRDRFRWNP